MPIEGLLSFIILRIEDTHWSNSEVGATIAINSAIFINSFSDNSQYKVFLLNPFGRYLEISVSFNIVFAFCFAIVSSSL